MTKLEMVIAIHSDNGTKELNKGQIGYCEYIAEKSSKKTIEFYYNKMLNTLKK